MGGGSSLQLPFAVGIQSHIMLGGVSAFGPKLPTPGGGGFAMSSVMAVPRGKRLGPLILCQTRPTQTSVGSGRALALVVRSAQLRTNAVL
jgi:hypothetical protein